MNDKILDMLLPLFGEYLEENYGVNYKEIPPAFTLLAAFCAGIVALEDHTDLETRTMNVDKEVLNEIYQTDIPRDTFANMLLAYTVFNSLSESTLDKLNEVGKQVIDMIPDNIGFTLTMLSSVMAILYFDEDQAQGSNGHKGNGSG